MFGAACVQNGQVVPAAAPAPAPTPNQDELEAWAFSPIIPTSSSSSWWDQELVAGVPNKYLAIAAVAAALFLFDRGKR